MDAVPAGPQGATAPDLIALAGRVWDVEVDVATRAVLALVHADAAGSVAEPTVVGLVDRHPDLQVRRLAVTSLGHLARMHGTLTPAGAACLARAATVPDLAEVAGDAQDDVGLFVRGHGMATGRAPTAALRCRAVRWVDDAAFPPVVEVELHDAEGRRWSFVDKAPVVDADLAAGSALPRDVAVRVLVVAGGATPTVSTAPDGVVLRSGDLTTTMVTVPGGQVVGAGTVP